MEPYIFDIIRSSFVDGPGLRTVVFFKGCNLNCFWCHNPEGKDPKPQLALFEEKCSGCGVCRTVCEKGEGPCTLCGACARFCPEGARKLYGRKYGDDELMKILTADRAFYDATGGGVTFSGGECMLYPVTVRRLGEKLHGKGISFAVDTAGNVPYEWFRPLFPLAPIFLYDVKAIDPELHKRGTGSDNQRILDNLDRLIGDGQKLIIRVPVIPGFNEGDEVRKIDAYLESRGLKAEHLPYHEMGESKIAALALAAQQ